tara:strand:+ start:6319 stop:6576 length:258 start_codon:yes stop_codon:yes gene_type:complete
MKIGDQIIANWGAMHPWDYGTITKMWKDAKFFQGDIIQVTWDSDSNLSSSVTKSDYTVDNIKTIPDDLFIDKVGIYHKCEGDAVV